MLVWLYLFICYLNTAPLNNWSAKKLHSLRHFSSASTAFMSVFDIIYIRYIILFLLYTISVLKWHSLKHCRCESSLSTSEQKIELLVISPFANLLFCQRTRYFSIIRKNEVWLIIWQRVKAKAKWAKWCFINGNLN